MKDVGLIALAVAIIIAAWLIASSHRYEPASGRWAFDHWTGHYVDQSKDFPG
jgi:hypothetical protein